MFARDSRGLLARSAADGSVDRRLSGTSGRPVAVLDGHLYLLEDDDGVTVRALDATTGEQQWTDHLAPDRRGDPNSWSMLRASRDRVYLDVAFTITRGDVGYHEVGPLVAYDPAGGERRWTVPNVVAAAVGERRAYAVELIDEDGGVADDRSVLRARDVETGQSVWTAGRRRAFYARITDRRAPIVTDGNLYVLEEQSGGQQVARYDPDTGDRLVATGQVGLVERVAAGDGRVVVATTSETVVGYDSALEREQWRRLLPTDGGAVAFVTESGPTMVPGTIYRRSRPSASGSSGNRRFP